MKESFNMKKNIFVDTSAFIAMRVFDDAKHKDAHKCLQHIKDEKIFLHTSNFILDEVYTYFCRHHDIAIEMANTLLNNPIITMHRVSAEDETKALQILKKHNDKAFSYTDATSFALMKRVNLETAFSYDKHFLHYGFTLLSH